MTTTPHPEFVKFLKQFGTRYITAIPPQDIILGQPGHCFDMSALNVMMNSKYRYVEGIAKPEGEWIYHGWLSDRGRVAYDPTWRAFANSKEIAPPWEYIGIELDSKSVLRFMMETQFQGVLANAGKDIVLAKKAVPSFLHRIILDSTIAL